MNDDNFRVNVIVGTDSTPSLQREYSIPRSSKFGYKINEEPTPDCFRMFWERNTVIVPLRNLILIEMTL